MSYDFRVFMSWHEWKHYRLDYNPVTSLRRSETHRTQVCQCAFSSNRCPLFLVMKRCGGARLWPSPNCEDDSFLFTAINWTHPEAQQVIRQCLEYLVLTIQRWVWNFYYSVPKKIPMRHFFFPTNCKMNSEKVAAVVLKKNCFRIFFRNTKLEVFRTGVP